MRDNPDHIVITICTRDRLEQVDRALREIARVAVLPRMCVRVQIIDNSIDGSARETVLRAGAVHGDIAYCHEPGGGIPGARNAALRERRHGEHLVFVDDDEWPEQIWLLRLWQVHEMDPSAIVGGGHVMVGEDGSQDLAREILTEGQRVDACAFGNVLLPASLLDRNELDFCARYRKSGGEDADFCFRAASLGAVTRLAPTAVTFEDRLKERSRVLYRMKRCFTEGAIYSDILRRQRRRLIVYRLAAIIVRALIGTCKIPLAAIQEEERYRGIEDICLAMGGFVGLFGYLPERYP
jgi:succinoglycan biosynthesis protein ExoM